MERTNLEIVTMVNILSQYNDKKFPQRITYAITKNLILLQKEYSYYEESLKKLFEKYSSSMLRDENGKTINDKNGIPLIKEESQEEFTNELTELLSIKTDIELSCIDPELFNYSDETGKYDSMSASDIMQLQAIICKGV